jgi:hypothetical protein
MENGLSWKVILLYTLYYMIEILRYKRSLKKIENSKGKFMTYPLKFSFGKDKF